VVAAADRYGATQHGGEGGEHVVRVFCCSGHENVVWGVWELDGDG
jgi:hypothetical protein